MRSTTGSADRVGRSRRSRLFAGLGIVVAGSMALAAFGSSSSASAANGSGKLISVTIARTDSNGLQSSVFNVAQQEGFFTKEGLKVTVPVLNGDAAAIPAVESGAVDFTENTTPPVAVADHDGGHLSIISALSYPPGEIVISKQAAAKAHITASTPTAKKVKALQGMTFAVEDVGGGLEYQLDALLLRYGVSVNSVHIIGIPSFTAELRELGNNTINGVSIVPPFGNVAVRQGAVMVGNVWGGKVPGLSKTPFEVIDGRTSYIQAHRQIAIKVQKAFALTLKFMHTHPSKAASINKKVLGSSFSSAAIKAAVGTGAGWPSSPKLSKTMYKDVISFMKISGLGKDTNVSYKQLVAPIAR